MISQLGNNAFTYDIILGIIFFIWICIYLVRKRKTLSFEKMAFPVFYAFLHREKYGISWMERFAEKHKQGLILLGYIGIGIGFVGMIGALFLIFEVARQLIFNPTVATVAPFVPFVNVPALGYISFSHWIITLFIVIVIHEAAHGVIAIAHGQPIKNTGFGVFAIFIPFIPLAFVEPDDKKIKKQKDIVQYSIYAAGPFSNFLLAIPLLLLMIFVIAPIESNITDIDGFTLDVIEGYPAELAGMTDGTLYNYIDGREITGQEFLAYMRWINPNQTIILGYIDSELQYSYEVTSVEHPDDPSRGFIGVQGIQIATTVSDKPWIPFFSWSKGLITLLFVVTISLGVINLFPAGITDGGQMLRVALDTVSKNKKRNTKILGILAAIFFGIILFAIVTYFTGNPFSLLFN